MQEYLEKLRGKPVHIKRTIAVSITTGLTIIIILLWLSFWMPGSNKSEQDSNVAAPGALVSGNWQGLKDAFSGTFSEIKNQIRF